ncbi:MAG: hypothetical protein ABL997_10180 [Planctomycetota bacterium]
MSAAPLRPRPRPPLRTRILNFLPTLIAVLWIAGIAQFRELPMTAMDYAVLLAFAIALQTLLRRLRPRPNPVMLPADANPTVVTLLAATLTGVIAIVVGAVLESLVPASEQGPTPFWLRTLWHGACAFAASYCRFLSRIVPMEPGEKRPPPR